MYKAQRTIGSETDGNGERISFIKGLNFKLVPFHYSP